MGVKVSLPLLDCMVATACELRCNGCTNGIGMLERLHIFTRAEIERDIENAAKAIHTHVLVMLGGEPLVHPELVELIRFAKQSGIADKVRVLTNGIKLHRMKPDFWAELDDLKISIYPGKTPMENVALAGRMQAEYGFALDYKPVEQDPFRSVHTMTERTDEDAQRTFDGCWYRTFTRKIEQGFFWRCCTSPSISKTLLKLPPEHDGLALEGLTAEQLSDFLARDTFITSCTRCHGNNGPLMPVWGEERDKRRWLEVSAA